MKNVVRPPRLVFWTFYLTLVSFAAAILSLGSFSSVGSKRMANHGEVTYSASSCRLVFSDSLMASFAARGTSTIRINIDGDKKLFGNSFSVAVDRLQGGNFPKCLDKGSRINSYDVFESSGSSLLSHFFGNGKK